MINVVVVGNVRPSTFRREPSTRRRSCRATLRPASPSQRSSASASSWPTRITSSTNPRVSRRRTCMFASGSTPAESGIMAILKLELPNANCVSFIINQ